MEFLLFLVRRILWSLLVLVGLSVVIFAIARVVPGDPAQFMLGLPSAAVQAFQGMLLFFLLAVDVLTNYRFRLPFGGASVGAK